MSIHKKIATHECNFSYVSTSSLFQFGAISPTQSEQFLFVAISTFLGTKTLYGGWELVKSYFCVCLILSNNFIYVHWAELFWQLKLPTNHVT